MAQGLIKLFVRWTQAAHSHCWEVLVQSFSNQSAAVIKTADKTSREYCLMRMDFIDWMETEHSKCNNTTPVLLDLMITALSKRETFPTMKWKCLTNHKNNFLTGTLGFRLPIPYRITYKYYLINSVVRFAFIVRHNLKLAAQTVDDVLNVSSAELESPITANRGCSA